MKKRKIIAYIAILLISVIVFTPIIAINSSAVSYGGSAGDGVYWFYDTVTGILSITGSGDMKDFTYENIPWYSYSEYIKIVTIANGVTSIGSFAFYNQTDLTSITIPDSITKIKYGAFINCINLASITIPDSVTIIESSVFQGCHKLKNFTIPYRITRIEDNLFKYCTSLSSIVISDSVSSIGASAFEYCTELKNITISDNITSIGDLAFYETGYYKNSSNWTNNVLYINKYLISGNDSLSGAYDIKSGTKAIAAYAFSNCVLLTSVIIPDSVKSIDSYVFLDCTKLMSVTIPNSVTSIGNGAFKGCIKLSNITIPNSVTYISGEAFFGCTALTSITIPDSIKSIDNATFKGCTALASITIPSTVTIIGYEAFSGCTVLTDISIPDNVTNIYGYAFYNTGYYNNSSNWATDVLYINNHLIIAKETISGSYSIVDGTKTIASNAFSNCKELKSVIIPNSINSLSGGVFGWCSGLTSITIPDSVTSISSNAFSSCTSLTSVTIPSSVTKIDYSAFNGCTALTSITIPDSVMSIAESAFVGTGYYNNPSNWTNGVLYINNHLITTNNILGAYSIVDGTKTIADRAFDFSKKITSIAIPNSVKTIGAGAFSGCTVLTSITIPDSVTSIGSSAFHNTGYYNNSANWTNGVLYINNHLIDVDDSLFGEFIIQSGTKSIGAYTFSNCSTITNITIPDSVIGIGDKAFFGCINIKQVFYGGTQDTWNTFKNSSVGNELLFSADVVFSKYTITWVVDDKTTTEEYEYGVTPSFKGSTEKEADEQYTYTFKGWDSEIEKVTGDAKYTAVYEQNEIEKNSGCQSGCSNTILSNQLVTLLMISATTSFIIIKKKK